MVKCKAHIVARERSANLYRRRRNTLIRHNERRENMSRLFMLVCFAAVLSCFNPRLVYAQCIPTEAERQIWDGIKQSSDPREFLAYLKQFPNGCYRALAIFKINALVDETVPMRVAVVFTEGIERVGKDGEWVDYDGWRVAEGFRFRATAVDQSKFTLEYQCDSAGKGLSYWVASDQLCHPSGLAPIQGFSVRMRGSLSEFYDLDIRCTTIGRQVGDQPAPPKQEHSATNEGWCGFRAGAGPRYVFRALLSAKRKTFK